jgi:hypothetical protein
MVPDNIPANAEDLHPPVGASRDDREADFPVDPAAHFIQRFTTIHIHIHIHIGIHGYGPIKGNPPNE